MHSWQQDSLTHTLTTAAGLKGGFLLFLFSQKASLEYWPKYLLWLLRRVTHGCHWWVLLRNHHCERIRKKAYEVFNFTTYRNRYQIKKPSKNVASWWSILRGYFQPLPTVHCCWRWHSFWTFNNQWKIFPTSSFHCF